MPYVAGGASSVSNQQNVQPTASVPMRPQPIVGQVAQPVMTEENAANAPSPSRVDPNFAVYGGQSSGVKQIQHSQGGPTQGVHQHTTSRASCGAANNEVVNSVSANTGHYSDSHALPVDGASSSDNREIVGEQLMDRLEEISQSQKSTKPTGADNADSER